MATTGRTAGVADADTVADELRAASFVRIVARADADGVAAAGLLGRALTTIGVPFQTSVVRTDAERAAAIAAGDSDEIVVLAGGADDDALVPSGDGSATERAAAVVRELGQRPDRTLRLAGTIAAGEPVSDDESVERRPGVGVPTAELADGLAHSTLVRTPFSGDPDATRVALADRELPTEDADGDDARAVASLVAIEAVRDAPPRAAEAIERVLDPIPADDSPFATVEGYADVLAATVRAHPGIGIALALGHDVADGALSVWREHAVAAHAAASSAEPARYDGLVVAKVGDAPVATTARLLRDYGSPEPVAVAVGDDAIGVAASEPGIDEPLSAALRATDATGELTPTRGYVETSDDDAIVGHLRGER